LPLSKAKASPPRPVSHDSARIGDALDAWEHGVVSRVNRPAAAGGLATGRPLREALQSFTPKEEVR
jgi:hypothetical protein